MALVLNCWESASVVGSTLTINKPSSSSADGDSPKNPAIGDLLIIVIGSDDNTATAQWDNSSYKPAGFTLINEVGNATVDCHCAAFYRVVDGTEGASFDVPSQSLDDLWGSCILVSGNPSLHLAGADVNDGTPPIGITGVSCTEPDCLAFYVAAYDGGDDGGFSVSGTGWAERAEIRTGAAQSNGAGCWGTRQMSGTGATGTATVSVGLSDGMCGFQFAIKPGVEAHGGQASISGNGALSGAATKVAAGAAMLGALGALAAIGVAAMLGVAAISGVGAATAVGAKSGVGVASVSGLGSLYAVGEKYEEPPHEGSAAISGGGAVAGVASRGGLDVGAISGSGDVAGTGIKSGGDAASVSGNGELVAVGEKTVYTNFSLTVEANESEGAASISGSGDPVGQGRMSAIGVGAVSSSGHVVGIGDKSATGSLSISGAGSVVADGAQGEAEHHSGAAAINGCGVVQSAGAKSAHSASLLPGSGGLVAVGQKSTQGIPSISDGGDIVAHGEVGGPHHEEMAPSRGGGVPREERASVAWRAKMHQGKIPKKKSGHKRAGMKIRMQFSGGNGRGSLWQ